MQSLRVAVQIAREAGYPAQGSLSHTKSILENRFDWGDRGNHDSVPTTHVEALSEAGCMQEDDVKEDAKEKVWVKVVEDGGCSLV